MKRNLLTAASVLFAFSAFAQLPVSETLSNKNVVLEEFTGIYCTYCPDGHKRAEAIRAANPSDVFLINIHTGGYAAPNGNDPDFRTSFGTALAGQSGLTGYPSGTVNRHVFSGSTTAMSRGDWASAASTILASPSYVNVALEADIDVATRVMTVDLEAYFTANGPASMNINVAVTQNNVEGPQTGASSFNPDQILPNGNYNHGHMLRHLITGQWGDVITTTSTGTKVTKQYTWTIPADINGIPVEIGDLQVIGFIVEGRQELMSGAEGPVSFTIPAGSNLVDLVTEDAMSTPSVCIGSVTPKIKVTNNETGPCVGYKISYSIDGGAPVTETVNAALAGGASATHTFPATMVSNAGNYKISYTVEVLSSSNDVEIKTGNNKSSSEEFVIVPDASNPLPFNQGFELTAANSLPNGTYAVSDMDYFAALDLNFITGSPSGTPVGGFGLSNKSLFFYFLAGNPGDQAVLYMDKLDVITNGNAFVTMDHAYTTYNGSNDKLEVFASDDCGETWTSVWMKSGSDLATTPEKNGQNIFIPEANEWATDTFSLYHYMGSEVSLKFVGTSDAGDALYLDNINSFGWTTSIKELFEDSQILLFPNPAVNSVSLSLNVIENDNVNIRVYDVAGRNVLIVNNQALTVGNNKVEINTADFTDGIYFVEVSSKYKSSTLRLVIQK